MCSPEAGVIGGIQAISAVAGANAAQAKARADSQYYMSLADSNDRQADQVLFAADKQKDAVQNQGLRDTVSVERLGKQVDASQRVTQAANGVALNSATAEDVANDTFNKQHLDEMAIRYTADSKTKELGDEALFNYSQLKQQGNQYRQAAGNATSAGDTAFATSLLGGASAVGTTAYNFSRAGK